MDIYYNVNDAVFDAKTPEELRDKLIQYFAFDDSTIPDISIEGDNVHLHIPDSDSEYNEFCKIANLCERNEMKKAYTALESFIKKHPRHSEAYRLKAQILREQGDIDAAFDTCIEALRCNPRNVWALLLMGNIFNIDKQDHKTAEEYYNRILSYFPNHAIAINNVAATFAEQGKTDEAIELFKNVIKIDETYANAYFGLASIYYDQKKYLPAFVQAQLGLKKGKDRPENHNVNEHLTKLLIAAAHAICEGYDFMNVVAGIMELIADQFHCDIRIEKDETLQVYAKMEYGPVHNRSWHVLKYNPKRPYKEHLMVHELTHLIMYLKANEIGKGKLVITTTENETAFRSKYSNWIKGLINKIGYTKAIDATGQILNAIMLQTMNCPLDLFVEQYIYETYATMRPIQLISLLAQENDNIQGIIGSMNSGFLPKDIINSAKVMNIVTSLNLENLYGINLIHYYKPSKSELDLAKDLYDEFEAYKDYTPGEEYDLVEYFAQTFNLEDFITIVSENQYFNKVEEDNIQNDLMKDALGDEKSPEGNSIDGLSQEQKERQDRFYERNKDGEDSAKTLIMAMHMVNALKFFKDKSKEFIKTVAFDIAMVGVNGISPDKDGYSVKSIPNKIFSGYEFLAYYYVSWKLFNPTLHKTLALPFDSAWEQAQSMLKQDE